MEIPPGTAHRVVGPVRTDPTGSRGPSRREAAGPRWRRSSRGLYVPASVPLTPEQRVVEAGFLVPCYGAVTGWGALAWLGGTWFTGTTADGDLVPVDLSVAAHRIRSQPGFHMTGDRFDAREAVSVDGIWVASAAMATFFAMRYARDAREAAVVLSMAAYADLVSVDEMFDYVLAHPSYTGVPQARDAVARADENCWSPMEWRLLDTWETAGFGRPLTNRPVFDLDGRHIGTPDVVDPRSGVVGQYDGGIHLVGEHPARDAVRDDRFAEHGLEVVVARAGDLGSGRWDQQLREAYARAERRPRSDRSWTLELPTWWVPTFTVAQRRALSSDQRSRWLRHRAA